MGFFSRVWRGFKRLIKPLLIIVAIIVIIWTLVYLFPAFGAFLSSIPLIGNAVQAVGVAGFTGGASTISWAGGLLGLGKAFGLGILSLGATAGYSLSLSEEEGVKQLAAQEESAYWDSQRALCRSYHEEELTELVELCDLVVDNWRSVDNAGGSPGNEFWDPIAMEAAQDDEEGEPS